MPEVSEIALTAEILNNKFRGKKIKKIEVHDKKYSEKLSKSLKKIGKTLPIKVNKIDSKGKLLWFELESSTSDSGSDSESSKSDTIKWYILNTFGLTGMWSFKKDDYTRMTLIFTNDKKIYYNDQLKFGTFKFINSEYELKAKLNSLGKDFLKDDFTEKEFWNKIKKLQTNDKIKNKPIVEILMDQKKLGSGLGNYLVAEILYRAKMSPHTLIKDITKERSSKLLNKINLTTKISYVSNITGYMKYLSKNLVKNGKHKNYHPEIKLDKDDKFEFLVYDKKLDSKGNKVKKEKIITSGPNKGRTTHWVPKVQK